MRKKKTDRFKLAEEIVATICESSVYAADSGLAVNVASGLWKLPVGVITALHTLVVLGNREDGRTALVAREVCQACLERTGGVVTPPEGQHFAVELKESARIGGRLWLATDSMDAAGLYPVERSDFAPHHLVALEGEQRQPVCLIPAAKMEIWTIDD